MIFAPFRGLVFLSPSTLKPWEQPFSDGFQKIFKIFEYEKRPV
jgi:hypothetical protein